jgi:RNA polymerase sigma-32 factor
VNESRSLAEYIEKVRAIPRLSREEEHGLALAARKEDQDAIRRLVEANLRFVVAVALQYRRYGIPIWELIEEGSLGLMLAVRRYDPERGTRFVTYAGYWIRAYVLDLVVKSTSMVGAGSGALRSKLFFRLRRERAQVAARVEEPDARIDVLAERFNVTPERMRALLTQLDARDVSLDMPSHADSSVTLLDGLRDESASQEAHYLSRERSQQLDGALGQALDALDQRERFIVEQRIMSDDELSLAELGRQLGISRERARQLEARAKRKLRQKLQPLSADLAA